MIKIFGKKVLDNKELEKDFKGLIGESENKPFECVGERDEVVMALSNYTKNNKSILTDHYKFNSNVDVYDYVKKHFDNNNNVPENYLSKIKEAL